MVLRRIPYYEFDEGLYEIDEFDGACIFVIVGKDRALVIDTGTGIGDLKWVIENQITDKPYDVALTHNHGDHTGGAGWFDQVWIHPADQAWDGLKTSPTLEFRRDYARLIAGRENKSYRYDVERDIREWERIPQKKPLSDGQAFELGGRKVTAFHCPGHTAGETAFLDDLTGALLIGDALNRNLLLGEGIGKDAKETFCIAEEGLKRIYGMRGEYASIYNSHHDFRGFGSPLSHQVLPDAIECLRRLSEGAAEYRLVPDALSPEGKQKKVAAYGLVEISCGYFSESGKDSD